MTPSKDTLEAVTPSAKNAISTAAASLKSDPNKLRADAVSLDVPVKVHGSRITEVPGAPPNTEPFEEETSTMIIFPNGGVLRMATAVSVGQMLVVTNQRTRQDAICRVLKARAYSNTQAYVEVEFTHRQAGYWGVHFPTDDEESSDSPLTAPTVTAEKKVEKPVVPTISMKVEGVSKAPATAPRNESAFASIGTHEDIQPPAASTEALPKTRPAAPAPAPKAYTPAPPPAPVAAAPVSLDLDEEEPVVTESRASRSFGAFSQAAQSAPSHARTPNFGSSLESSSSQRSSARSGNWMWMAACAAFLVVGVAGGAFYFRQHSSSVQSGQVSGTAQVAENSVRSAEPSSAPALSVQQNNMANPAPAPSSIAPEPVAERPSRTAAQSSVQLPSAPAIETPRALAAPVVPAREVKPAPSSAANAGNSFQPLSNRPLARRNGGSAEADAPSIGMAPSGPGALPGMLGSPNIGAVSAPGVAAPAVGASVLPKLVHSVAPVYPSAARQGGVFGNVVIQAQVDKQGNVVSTKVLSGPSALQLAAMAAVKDWKYQPATLDGAPVPAQVTVTIRFQTQ